MQLGIGSYTYGWAVDQDYASAAGVKHLNENGLVAKARNAGLKLIQVGDNLAMHDWSESRLNAFKHSLKENDLTLEIGAKKLNIEQLGLYIPLCKIFGVKLLRFIIDDKDYAPGVDEIIRLIFGYTEKLKENNITLALENHDRLKAVEYVNIISAISSQFVGICLDTVNSMGAGESFDHIIDILAPYTVNLHIKDFGITRLPHRQGFVVDGRIAGTGMLNIPGLVENLNKFNRCQTAILEQWVPPGIDYNDTIRKEEEWADRSIAYLKSLPVWNMS